jgi:CBS domain-containing protein
MLVRDVMKRAVCIGPDESVAAAARKLKERNIGCLPVCEAGRLLGMITDRDIAMRSVADARSVEQTTVRELMSSGAMWCSQDDSVHTAADLMHGAHVRRLVVLDRERRVAGVVSLTDLGCGTSSERRPFEIVFYKEILDHAGHAHRSELMRVAVAQGSREAAIDDAVWEFQAYTHVTDWRTAADGFEVIATNAGQ